MHTPAILWVLRKTNRIIYKYAVLTLSKKLKSNRKLFEIICINLDSKQLGFCAKNDKSKRNFYREKNDFFNGYKPEYVLKVLKY